MRTDKLELILKTSKLKEYRINFGTFNFSFNCVVGEYKNLPKYLAYKYEEEEKWISDKLIDINNVPNGRFFTHKDYSPNIWIPKKPTTPREIATLSHEILHVVYELCRWAQIPLCEETEEVRTHAQAYALTTLLTEIK